MYVTPGIQNLIRENKVFRIDSEIQTGKKYGMQLLDDSLYTLYQAGKISAEEAIDKSKVASQMMDRFERAGVDMGKLADEMGVGGPPEESPDAEAGGAIPREPKPPGLPGGGAAPGASEAERAPKSKPIAPACRR